MIILARLFRVFSLALLVTSCLLLSACSPKESFSSGAVDLTGLDYGNDFHLRDANGKARSMADFKGKVVMLFFGFTQCPDVCPTALTRAAEVRSLLKNDATQLQVIFITVDPERDTPDILKSYTTAFDPSFLGLSGDLDATRKTADAFKVYYKKVPTGSSYTMDHTAITYLLDPSGKTRLAIRPAASAEDIIHDVRELLREAT